MDNAPKFCMNCHTQVEGEYCSNCGQSIKTKRFTNKYLFIDLPVSILNLDNKFFFTIKSLILHPIDTAIEYIEGKRVKYYKPFSLLLILFSISFALNKLLITDDIKYKGIDKNLIENVKFIDKIFTQYPQILIILMLPFYGFGFYLAFKKYKKYNFAEFVYLSAFITAFSTITFGYLNILYNYFLLKYTSYTLNSPIVQVPNFIIGLLFIILFFYFVFSNVEKNKFKLFFRSILGIILTYLSVIIFMIILMLLIFAVVLLYKFLFIN